MSYILVKIDSEVIDAEDVRRVVANYAGGAANVRTADVTDVLTYNRSTPGDPWDKPYPAMYAEMVERLS